MNRDDVKILIDYHYWACARLLDAVEPLPSEQFTRDMSNSFRSIRDTLAHIYAAEWIWLSRWQGESPTALLPPETFPDVTTARNVWKEHEAKMRAFWNAVDDTTMNDVIQYKSTEGEADGVSAVADASARRESRVVSSRPSDHDASAARRRSTESHGSHRVLPRARRGIAITTSGSGESRTRRTGQRRESCGQTVP